MTTSIKITCNGDYVAVVKQDDRQPVNVGPGNGVERAFIYPHPGPTTLVIVERPASSEEIEASRVDSKVHAK